MKSVSLQLDELIFEETEGIRLNCHKPRNKYINEALSYYNRIQKRLLLEETLKYESKAVSASSLEVLKEFEEIDEAL